MDLNEELHKRHGITRITSLHHAELTPAMLPQSIGHYRGWIYDRHSFTLDQVRAFVYNASLSCVSAAQVYELPLLLEERPQQTHLSVRHNRGMHHSKLRRFDDVCIHWEPVLSAEEERTHVASIGTVLERVLVCMPLKVSLPMLDAARNRGLYDVSTLTIPPTGSRLVGQNQTYTVQEGDKNLQAIARRFDTAAMLILEANNTIAPVPKPGTTITIPSQLLLPDAPRQGIIVNLAELRLYYYPPGENIVQVYPIGIGLQGWKRR